MTFWILMVLATVLTYFSFRYRNIALSLASTLSWFGLWVYNLSYPPTNITAGSLTYDILFYTLLIMAAGVMVMYWFNRQRGYTGYPEGQQPEEPPKGLMDLSEDEYRNRPRRRSRKRI